MADTRQCFLKLIDHPSAFVPRMDPSCSMSSDIAPQSSDDLDFDNTPPSVYASSSSINSDPRTTEEIVEKVNEDIELANQEDSVLLLIVEDEKSDTLDRRKSAELLTLERLERADFKQENALINKNHSVIVNSKELLELSDKLSQCSNSHLFKSNSITSKPSTSCASNHEHVNNSDCITTTPVSRFSVPLRKLERTSSGVKLNLSASLERVAAEAGPSSSYSANDLPSGSRPNSRLNKSDGDEPEPSNERMLGRKSVSHLDLVNLGEEVDKNLNKCVNNSKKKSLEDLINEHRTSRTRRSDELKLNRLNLDEIRNVDAVHRRLVQEVKEPEVMILEAREVEIEFEDDTWADCEEGTDEEEVCTCIDYNDASISSEETDSSEDELPSRDVDLSGYTQMETITQAELLQESHNMGITPEPTDLVRTLRKRKLTSDTTWYTSSSAKKPVSDEELVALYAPRTPMLETFYMMPGTGSPGVKSNAQSPGTGERRTPRSLIPSRDNPPPELADWLIQFQRWSHAERLLAVDRLIERCEPTQVRHMMQVIEPQFQRDFISLLPKELALSVLSFLEPKDLLRAAQTCRNWRFLADDNLLWKDKCRAAGILPIREHRRARWSKLPHMSSPWKAAYMRQHTIEMNWRTKPIRPPKVLKGHDDHVITCLQFSGNRIVSGSDDNTLKVWSAVTGKCLRTLVGHTGGVWSSQMAGSVIISGSTDRTLKVWDAESGDCTHTLYGHTSTVRCMHLHGHKVVSGSRDATLRVWDIAAGACLHVLVGHLAAVRCVQYDGKLVVSGAYDYMVKVWNPEREECLHTLQGHTNRVYSLQFDGVHVVSGSLDTSIRVWEVESGSCKHTLMGHQSLTSGMELRNNILVSGNADSTVKVWDIVTGQCLQTLSGPNKHQSAVTCLQFNSRFVITSSDDGTVKLWDVKTGEFIRNLVALASGGSGGVVWRIRANDTKLICAVGSRNGTEETKLMVLDFDVEGACVKCS